MEHLSERELLRRLEFDNPWWAFRTDTRVRFRHPATRGLAVPVIRRVLSDDLDHPLVLAGPSGTGKTIVLRQALAAVVRGGLSPLRIAFLSLSAPIYTEHDLVSLIDRFLARFEHVAADKLCIFLDDLNYLPDGLAQLANLQKRMPQTRLVAAMGAGAPRLTAGPAADGSVEVMILPPLDFNEFMTFRDAGDALGPLLPETADSLELSPMALARLNDEFARYITFGGFPSGIAAGREDEAPPALVRGGLLHDTLRRDLAGYAGVNDPHGLGRLFAILARNTAGEASIEELATATGVAKNTLRKYLDFLEDAFLIRRLPRLDKDGKPFQRQVLFKVYLTSPTLYTAMFGPVDPAAPEFARLVETAVVGHCYAKARMDRLAYASWKGGMVDLIELDEPGGRPQHLFQMDWREEVIASSEGPATMVNFAVRANPDAHMTILTQSRGGPARRGAVDINLLPAALYAHWLGS
ncbi:MAG: AAA family ATPase [Rhodospirillaceae bacterium]